MTAGAGSARPGTVGARARAAVAVGLIGHAHADGVVRRYAARVLEQQVRRERREAHDGLSASLAVLSDDVDRRLAGIFREYVGANIRAVSPLVATACRVEGLDLDTLVGSLRHDGGWRPWLGGPPPAPMVLWRNLSGGVLDQLQVRAAVRQFQRCGVVIREDGEALGALGVRVGASCLEIAVRTERMDLTTRDGRAVLTLRHDLPETIRLAARGRLVEEVVDHPLTNGRGYRIGRIVDRPGVGASIVFHVEPLPWRLPWARVWVRDPAAGHWRPNGG